MRNIRRSKKLLENYVCPRCLRQINKCICELYPPQDLIWIDINMQEMIIKLNEKGYKTWGCCESHTDATEGTNIHIAFAWDYEQIDVNNLPDGFRWLKKRKAIVFEYPKNITQEEAEKIKIDKLKLLSDWVDGLPDGATPIYD